ncbi:hypothetical protein FOCC_FOCC016822, partial [Frankliniella occidentalis]
MEYVSLTADCWTSRALDAYISLTAHAITKAWKMTQYTLCTEGMEGSHTVDHLATSLVEMTTSITRDNGSNIVNAVSLIDFVEFNVSCAAHLLQLCVNDALKKNAVFMAACKKAK